MISRHCTLMILLLATWLVRPTHVVAQDAPEALAAIEATEASPLITEPTTPAEHMKAVIFTMKIARPEAAKKYIEALLALDPDDATLIGFRTEYGTGTFLQLARFPELNPPATVLLERLNAASTRQASDPVFMDGVLKNLSGSSREADLAMRDLQHLGAPAASRLVQAAADPNSGVDRDQAFIALTRMGESAVAPLIGYLFQGDEAQKSLAVDAFGWVATKNDAAYLYSTAFATEGEPGLRQTARQSLSRLLYKDPSQAGRLEGFGAAAQLRITAEKLLKGETVMEPEEDGLVPVWVPDETSASLVERRVTPHSAAIFRAEQFARQSLELAPTDTRTQSVLLNTILTRDIEAAGWDQPIPSSPGSAHEVAILSGSSACLEALALANEMGNTAAAESLVRALAQNGSASLLRTGGQRGAIVAALDHPSLRVQYAAAETILLWDPQQPFSGSRRVVEILARALNADARANGVVVDPNNTRGSTMATFLNEMGYDAQILPTGAAGFEAATTQGDMELAVLHLNTIRWDLSPTIANFRADSRTKNMPIAIYGPHGFRRSIEHLLARDPLTTYVEESVLSTDLSRQLRPFLAQVEPPTLTQAQQSMQSLQAAKWLRKIADSRTHVYDLTPAEDALVIAAPRTDQGDDALIALGAIPTAGVQIRLAEAALNSNYPAPKRALAASLTAAHIRRHQSLLSDDLRMQLVTVWNHEADPAVRSALGSVVGVQGPNAQGVPTLLKSSAPAMTPNP